MKLIIDTDTIDNASSLTELIGEVLRHTKELQSCISKSYRDFPDHEVIPLRTFRLKLQRIQDGGRRCKRQVTVYFDTESSNAIEVKI